MSTDGWIKMSERKPTYTELPFWVNTDAGVWLWETDTNASDVMSPGKNVTHWQPAVLPAPPKKELTQRDRDEEAVRDWFSSTYPQHTPRGLASDIWHAALAYRDKQNAGDFTTIRHLLDQALKDHGIDHSATLEKLRRRCGLDT